ncbi:MAG: acyl-homoserine-lactone synthase [Mesorhizobium sp.]
MIEAHVVDAKNLHLYEPEFDQFLRLRHDYFVDRKGWRPPAPDGREWDQFDTAHATYLLGIEDGRVVTSCRMIPTNVPHLVSEVFPDMCEQEGVPRRPDWAEWTRTFVVSEHQGLGRRGRLTQICCAVMEYAVEEGLRAVGGIQELYFLAQHRMLRWKVRPLGLAREVNGEWCIVAFIEVSGEALASARRVLGISHSLLVRRGEPAPFLRTELRA